MKKEIFWRWIYKIAQGRITELYTNRTGWDLKCPTCLMWASIVGMEHHSENSEQTRYTCGQCNTLTAWHFEGPVAWPVPVDYFNQSKGGSE